MSARRLFLTFVEFYATVGALALLFGEILAWAIRRGLRPALPAPAHAVWLALIPLGLAWLVAEGLFVWQGRSRRGKLVEEWRRPPIGASSDPAVTATIEVLIAPWLVAGSIVVLVGMAALVWLIAPARFAAGVGGLALALAMLVGLLCRRPVARIDERGIAGCGCGDNTLRKSLVGTIVPWSDIASCTVTTRFDLFGRPSHGFPMLKDARGETLLTLNLVGVSQAERLRLLEVIQRRLPDRQPIGDDGSRPALPVWLAFHGSVMLATVVLAAIALAIILRAWGPHALAGEFGQHAVFFVAMTAWSACYCAADQLLKRLGLSRSGKAIHRRTRAPLLPSDGATDRNVAIGPNPGALAVAALSGTTAVGLVLIVIAGAFREPTATAGLLLLAGVSALGAYVAWSLYRWPPLLLDSRGITLHKRRWWRRSRQFVAWDEIGTCVIETTYDPIGTPILVRPIVLDARGTMLLDFTPARPGNASRSRLLRALEAHLPKVTDELDQLG